MSQPTDKHPSAFAGFSFPKPDPTTPAAAEVPDDAADGKLPRELTDPVGAAAGLPEGWGDGRHRVTIEVGDGDEEPPLGAAPGDCTCPDLATLDANCPQHGGQAPRCSCIGLPGKACDVHGKPTPGRVPPHLCGLAHDGTPLTEAEGWTGENPQLYADPPPIPPAASEDQLRLALGLPSKSTGQHARDICETAADLVNGDRNSDYGDALDNFTETAALWSPILGVQVTAEQVALCMAQVKIARLIHNTPHDDSWVDGVGYLALGGGIARRRRA